MDPLEFAQRFLHPYRTKGDEIVPTHCPYCHGGSHGDKYTFALNVEKKTYNCKRGSCGAQGHFTQLCQEFGVQPARDNYIPPRKAYKKPEQKPRRVHEAAEEYLRSRKISKATAEAYRIGADDNGNLMFPYYDDTGEHVFNKFRYPRKLEKGERKAWREADTKPVLFGMHLCDTAKPLTIYEGEFDAMAGHEASIPNSVSVPSGAEDFTWVDTCWDFIQQFDSIYIYGDNDTPGREMVRRLAVKLGDKRVFIVQHDCKDANELLYRQGVDAVRSSWEMAKEIPVAGLLNLAEVVPLNVEDLEGVNTSISALNKMIGGFYYGDVSVFTGRRGEGKSTLLSMLMLDAIEDGKKVCAYSGELRADRFQYWADLQAAGKENISEYHDHSKDRQVYYVPREIRDKIHAWYSGKYWLYDNSISVSDEEVTILQAFEMAAKRYDCKVFLVDNLMTADYGKISDSDFYRQQSRFVGHLVSFANKYNVHVWLVAHPRKTSGALGNDDVSGSGDITNRVANVIALSKVAKAGAPCDLTLEVTKNRWEGNCGTIGLDYCNISHRLYVPELGDVRQYGWQDHPEQMDLIELDPSEPVPW